MDVLPPLGISSHCESVSHRINVYVYEVISVRPLFLFGETHSRPLNIHMAPMKQPEVILPFSEW